MRRPSELWGRRTAAAGLVLIALAALGGGILLATDDDSDETTTRVDPEQLAEERLTEEVRDARNGIAAAIPEGWSQRRRSGLITLESADRCVSISLAAPVRSPQADSLLDDTVAQLRREFKGARVQKGSGQRVGGLQGPGAVLVVENSEGGTVRVLITVGRGKRKAYLTQVVLRDPSCEESLVESQLVLNSVAYAK